MPEIPEGATVPADHQPKKTKAEKEADRRAAADSSAAEGLDQQITVELDDATYAVIGTLADLELMEWIADYSEGKLSLAGRIIRRLIGTEQYEEFKAKYRDPSTGVVSNVPAIALISKIDRALGE